MCGIVCVHVAESETSKDIQKLPNVFANLIYASGLRGVDSAGIALMKHITDDSYDIVKSANTPLAFINSIPFRDAMKESTKYAHWIGHTRAATKGAITHFNAHPFDIENVVGLHNGTLWNYQHLVGWEESKEYKVDSQFLLRHISDNLDNLPKAMSSVIGDYAVAFWNKITREMHYINNGKRPLALITIKGLKASVVVSEHMMGQWVLTRNGFEVDKVLLLKPHHLYTLKEDPREYDVVKVEEARSSFFTYGRNGTTEDTELPQMGDKLTGTIKRINYHGDNHAFVVMVLAYPDINFYIDRKGPVGLEQEGDLVRFSVRTITPGKYPYVTGNFIEHVHISSSGFKCELCNTFSYGEKFYDKSVYYDHPANGFGPFGPLCGDCMKEHNVGGKN